MTDQHDGQRGHGGQDADMRRQREREYEIDRITFEYAAEYRSGRAPRIEAYVQRYPQYATELMEYALDFHAAGFVGEPLEEPADLVLSPAAEKALARIREQHAEYQSVAPEAPVAIEGLVKRGIEAGYTPPQLAAAVGLTPDLLDRLEAHAIALSSIPRTLLQRLATTLKAAPEAIAAYLGAPPAGQAGGFYYAEQPPEQQQATFLDAVQTSALPPEGKREWAEIVKAEIPTNE